MKPIQAGLALSVTVALFYSLCTLIEVLWPAQFIGFMNALFHGLDFQPMRSGLASPWSDYFFALPVVALRAGTITRSGSRSPVLGLRPLVRR